MSTSHGHARCSARQHGTNAAHLQALTPCNKRAKTGSEGAAEASERRRAQDTGLMSASDLTVLLLCCEFFSGSVLWVGWVVCWVRCRGPLVLEACMGLTPGSAGACAYAWI